MANSTNSLFYDSSLSSLHLADMKLWQFSSQKQKSRSKFATSTLPNRLKRSNNSIRHNADIIRYASSRNITEINKNLPHTIYNKKIFSPNVHSTPINQNKHNATKNISSINALRPHPLDQSNRFKCQTTLNIPTISKKVDLDNNDVRYMPNFTHCNGKIVKKRGIQGVSWVLRLALDDDSIGKIYRSQIGWISLIFVVFLTIGGLLAYFSKYISINYFVNNFTINDVDAINLLDINMSSVNNYTHSITERGSIMQNLDTNFSITLPEIKFQTDIAELENKTDNVLANQSKNDDELVNLCKCQESSVCIVESDSGIPICKPAIDIKDPTGCGGLCKLETEACQLLHHRYPIYTCKLLEILPLCESDQWRCTNHLCIPSNQRCDGIINCYDRSDEYECNNCDLKKNFQCRNKTSCLDNSKRCNGIVDCWDASDEYNCTNVCLNNQFSCANGDCIRLSLFCDGFADCKDKSDEPIGCSDKCGHYEYQCANTRCISKSQICNGSNDCGDMSDEFNCSMKNN